MSSYRSCINLAAASCQGIFMAHQVLARKWRPQSFQEVAGQGHVTRSLQNTLMRQRPGHAYLLTGTRGVGKTTLARLFARALRCENRGPDGNPCRECRGCREAVSSSLNVLEIDGADHNSVEDIRSLISEVQTLPTFGGYKIYIIDEVHMLSTSAFNALLKTLEAPPAHVVFILATTVPEKLLETVVSRCQRFDLKRASVEVLTAHVEHIAAKEGLEFSSKQVIETLCTQGRGSFRDTLSLLDQVLCFMEGKTIDGDTLAMALGLAKTSSVEGLVSGLLSGDTEKVREFYLSILQENVPLESLCSSLLDSLYKHLGGPSSYPLQELFWIYETLAQDMEWALKSLSPEKVIEIVLLKVALRRTFLSLEGGDPPPAKALKSFSWEGFLKHIGPSDPMLAERLEHGNLLSPVDVSLEKPSVCVAFRPSGKIFYDLLSENKEKLKTLIAGYLERSSIDLELLLMDHKDERLSSFKTWIDIQKEKEEVLKKEKEARILNGPLIKEAENVFNSKVDTVSVR